MCYVHFILFKIKFFFLSKKSSKRFLFLSQIKPAIRNKRFDGIDDAGMYKHFFANSFNFGLLEYFQ